MNKAIGAVGAAILALSLAACGHQAKPAAEPATSAKKVAPPSCPKGQEQVKGAKPGVCAPIVPVAKKGKAVPVRFSADTAEQGYLSTTGEVTLIKVKSVPEIPGDSYNEPDKPQRGRYVGVELKVRNTGAQELWMGSASYEGDDGQAIDDVEGGVNAGDLGLGEDITASYPKPGMFMKGGLVFDVPTGHGFIVFTGNEGTEQFKIKV